MPLFVMITQFIVFVQLSGLQPGFQLTHSIVNDVKQSLHYFFHVIFLVFFIVGLWDNVRQMKNIFALSMETGNI